MPELGLAPSPVAAMSSGSEHACALRTNGVVECWGENAHGEAPPVVEARNGWFTHVDVSDQHSCAVRSDGVIQCWGSNSFGKAPDSVVAGAGQFVRVATGGDHTCALRTDGRIQCWGDNGDGQAPATVTLAGGSYQRVTAGLFHTCGLDTAGVAHCWGWNHSGQSPLTRASSSGSGYVSLSSSTGFTCAVRADGVAECFGSNEYGASPDSVRATASSFTQVSAGFTHACALRADGVIQCWGSNANGEAPATWTAPGGGRFTHVSAGNQFTCGTLQTGFLRCIGSLRAPLPPTPASIAASASGAVMSVTWPDVRFETTYQLQRRTGTNGVFTAWRLYAQTGRNGTAYADSALVAGTDHQYRVRACAAGGCSLFLASQVIAVDAAPAPPSSATATPIRGGVVDVAWQDGAGNETRFEIDRRHVDASGVAGPWGRIGDTDGAAAVYRDSTAVRAERYRYRVRACSGMGCSAFLPTAQVRAERIGTAPATVTSTPLSPTQIQVQWSASTNAATYQIQRRMMTGTTFGAWQSRATVTATAGPQSWTESGLTPNTVYQYRVRGCTVIGCSAFTGAVRTRTPS